MSILEIFRLVASEFNHIPDEQVQMWIEICLPMVSKSRFGKLYEQAVAYLTAHRMKMNGLGDDSLGSIGDALRVGSYSEGETSISFSGSSVQSDKTAEAEFGLTVYGLQYLTIKRSVIMAITCSGENSAR